MGTQSQQLNYMPSQKVHLLEERMKFDKAAGEKIRKWCQVPGGMKAGLPPDSPTQLQGLTHQSPKLGEIQSSQGGTSPLKLTQNSLFLLTTISNFIVKNLTLCLHPSSCLTLRDVSRKAWPVLRAGFVLIVLERTGEELNKEEMLCIAQPAACSSPIPQVCKLPAWAGIHSTWKAEGQQQGETTATL